MSKDKLTLRSISLKSKNLDNEILLALQQDGIFAVTDLPDSTTAATRHLVAASNNFFDRQRPVKHTPFDGDVTSYPVGYYGSDKHAFSSVNGNRFFVSFNLDDNKIENSELPLLRGEPVMEDSATLLRRDLTGLFQRVMSILEREYYLKEGTLTRQFCGGKLINMTRNDVVTREKIREYASEGLLHVCNKGENKIITFAPHRDASALTFLHYPNGVEGLEVEVKDNHGHKRFVPVRLSENASNKVHFIIFSGRVLKAMLNDDIVAIKHRVVTTAKLEQRRSKLPTKKHRFTLAMFSKIKGDLIPDINSEVKRGKKLKQGDRRGKKRERSIPLPISFDDFFHQHLEKYDFNVGKQEGNKKRKHLSPDEVDELAEEFPRRSSLTLNF